jgi:AraC-like DNA-binding protein
MQVMFETVALYWAVRGWRADVDEVRRLLRGLFLVVVGGLLFGTGVVELSLIDAATQTRAPFDNAVTLLRALGYVIVALSALRFDSRVFERIVVGTSLRPVADDEAGLDRDLDALTRALETEKIYLTHGLSIGSLAGHLGIPEYRLRRVINKRLGYRNFNALLHHYRLREACLRLANPARADVPILTIALEVGYRSITPFNQAFRSAIGCTPSAYRQQHAKSA